MFEAQLAYYLNRYLGTYVQGLDTKSLKISVFKGDVTLRNLKLKAEALADLNLPITVKAGLLGSLTLKIPWTNLGKSAVVVYIDRLYILAGPKTEAASAEDGTYEAEALEREAKRHRVDSAELASMRAKDDGKGGGGGMFKGLIDTIIGNLQLSIGNVHIRYEDDVSYPGKPFAVGLTLEALSAHTVDESGKEAFVTQNPLKLLRKASHLKRLALYFDVGTKMWKPEEDWQQLSPQAWDDLFRPGIAVEESDDAPVTDLSGEQAQKPEDSGPGSAPRSYVLKPIDGRLLYLRRGKDVRQSEEEAIQEADITLQSISLHLSKGQYLSLQKLLEAFSSYSARAPNRYLRPVCRPDSPQNARQWWQYAGAVARRQIRSQSFNWRQFERAIEYRSRYVQQYVQCLHDGKMGGDEATAEMDAQLNEHTILTFRKLAHAKVELAKKREAAKAAAEQRERQANRGWLSWAWGGSGSAAPKEGHEEAEDDGDMRGELNEEEREALQGLASEQADALKDEKESPYSLRTQLYLSVQSASLVLDGPNDAQILRAGLEDMTSSVQMFPSTMKVDLMVTAFGLLAPEGQLIRTGGHMHHSRSAMTLSGSTAGQPQDSQSAAAKPQAMRLEYIQHPQDESSDAAVHFVLAPSYVTYNAVTIQHVQDFFKTEEVMDFSALGAQAVAQVERAQRAARDQVMAAMNQRPKLSLKLQLEGPKIAVPVPASGLQGKLTLVVDLGSILLESDMDLISKLPQEEAALYECLRLSSRDISAYVVDGDFSFHSLEAAGASSLAEAEDGTSPVTEAITAAVREAGGRAFGGKAVFVPLLERCKTETTVQIARAPHPTLPSLRAQLSVPRLRFFVSAARVRRLMRVLRSALPGPAEGDKGPASSQPVRQEQQQKWRTDCEHSGTVRVLEWGGVTRTTALWPKKWAALYRGSLYVLDSEDASAAPAVHNVWSANRRVAKVPEAACGGVKNVLAVCGQDTKISKAAQQRDSLLLRFKTEDELEEWDKQLHRSQQNMRELAGSDPNTVLEFGLVGSEDDSQSETTSQAQGQRADPSSQQAPGFSVRLAADLGEFSVFVSGRPADIWWPDEDEGVEGSSSDETQFASPPGAIAYHLTDTQEVVNVDSERSLIVIRASKGSTDLSMGDGHFSTSLAVDAFEIEDLLVGPRCPAHAYLARSFVATREFDNEGDEFFDAGGEPSSPSFMARSMDRASSQQSEALSFADASSEVSSQAGSFKDAPGPSELWDVKNTGGKAAETAPAKKDSAWILDFDSWAQGSSGYAGVDSEMRMRLKTLYFAANRPTIGALIALGGDVGAAFSSGKPEAKAVTPSQSADTPFAEPVEAPKQQPQVAGKAAENVEQSGDMESDAASTLAPSLSTFKSEIGDSESGNLVLEGGRDRVVFRLLMEVERLEATFNYESATAPPLLLAAIEDVRFNLSVNPGTLVINASLGNMRAQDCVLPEGHPYRNVLDLRHGASTSLIELEFASHTGKDSDTNPGVPAGLPFYTLNAQLRELELVFLNRFMQEILRYISLLLAMQPAPLERPDFAEDAGLATGQEAAAPAANKQPQSGVGFLLLLDVEAEAPVITMPRSSDSQDFLEVDLGTVKMTNHIKWLFGTNPRDKKAVLLEEDTLVLSGLRAVVSSEGEHGENLIREDEAGFTVLLRRPVRDLRRQLPNIEVGITIPSIKATVSDREYRLITSVAGQNFGEELRLPGAALWLEEAYRPESFEDAEAERAGSGQTEQPSQALTSVSEMLTEEQPKKASSQTLRSRKQDRTTLRVVVNIGKSELEMLRTSNAATGSLAPLARFTIENLWVAFRSTESGAMHLLLSVPRVEGADLRPWVPPEHSLVISSARNPARSGAAEVSRDSQDGSNVLDWDSASFLTLDMETAAQMSVIKLKVRLQRPTISAEMSFLLAVMKFYVPDFAIASVTPIPFQTQDVLLTGEEYKATRDLWLSPQSRLLADSPEASDFVYNGQGHRLILPEGLHEGETLPLIIVGVGKSLQLKDVKLVHAACLPACIQLGSGAQLICREEDKVVRILGEDPEAGEDAAMSPARRWAASGQSIAGRSPSNARSRSLNKALSRGSGAFGGARRRSGSGRLARSGSLDGALQPKKMHLELELVAIGVGLQFVELEEGRKEKEIMQTKRSAADLSAIQADGKSRSVRMLAAYMDLGARYKMVGKQQRASAELRGLRIETRVTLGDDKALEHPGSHVQGTVLEPCKVGVRLDLGGDAGDIQLTLSDLRMNLSPDVLELALSLQSSVLEPLVQPPPDRPLARTTTFVQIWSNHPPAVGPAGTIMDTNILSPERGLTFWRPKPPIGYASLGDCVTTGTAQPSFQVVAMAVNSGLVTFPVSYSVAYKTSGLTIWAPQPPAGYAALGCVANPGDDPPALTEVVCIAAGIGVEAPLGSCLVLKEERSWRPSQDDGGHLMEKPRANVWCVENAGATFLVCSPENGSPDGPFLDLRSPLGVTPAALKTLGTATPAQTPEPSPPGKQRRGAQPGMSAPQPKRALAIKGGGDHLPLMPSPGYPPLAVCQPQPERPATPAAKKAAESLAQRPQSHKSYQEFQRSRAKLLRSVSQRRAQSTAVDFRRIWWDKDRRAPSRAGMSLWRPLPPTGYISLGDCLEAGYDPPQSVVVLLDSELAEMEHTSMPSVRMPRGFELVWKDEGDRADRCLSIWRPVPFPGYVALGYVASRGETPPAKQSIRCVNARSASSVDLSGTRPAVRLPQTTRRSGFSAWTGDERMSTFVLSAPGQPPRQGELQRLKLLDAREPRPAEGPVDVPKGGMNIVLKTGASSLLLRDALRRPLAEIELGEVDASLRRVDSNVTRAYVGVHMSAWSYNNLIQAWEPILEPWNVIMKADMNTGGMASHGVDPGAHISVQSTSELMRVTLAYAAVQSIFRALRQWRDLHAAGSDEAYRRQLAAADAASVHTHVTNALGVAAEMQLDFGDNVRMAELPAGEATPVLQPLPRAARRHSQRLAVPASAQPPTLLVADIDGLQGLASSLGGGEVTEQGSAPELYLSLSLPGENLGSITSAANSWGARTRAVTPQESHRQASQEGSTAAGVGHQNSEGEDTEQQSDSATNPEDEVKQGSRASESLDVRWSERLVLELPPDTEEDEVTIEVELWDSAASGGVGRKLGQASVALDMHAFEPFEAQPASVELLGKERKVADLRLQWALLPQFQTDKSRTTDAWNAGPSTAGQRALRLAGAEDWAPVYSSSQTIAASSSQALKMSSKNRDDTTASVIPVRMRAGTVALESSFRGGIKRELLRSLCQVVNDTQLRLEVALVEVQRRPSARSPSSRPSGFDRADSMRKTQEDAIKEELFENERYLPIRGWGASLLPTERRRYSTRDGSQSFNDFPTMHLPPGWEWEGPWEAEDWTYAPDWSVMSYPPTPSSKERNLVDFVRRRRWVRRRRRQQISPGKAAPSAAHSGQDLGAQPSVRSLAAAASAAQEGDERQVLGVAEPGQSLPLPHGWRSSGKQLVVRPMLEGFPNAHLWSIGATEGTQSIRLDTLDEGQTRLLACPPASPSRPGNGDSSSTAAMAKAARQSGEGGAAELASAPMWFSTTVEAESLPGTSRSESITDWRIIVAAPLVLDNQLPHKGSFLIWERPKDGENLILRQSGALASGERQHVYAADMRREVSLQFYPDGFEWLDRDPVPLSLGYSSHSAGVDGQQNLPDSFQVARATGSEAPQSVYINRELDLDVWQLADKKLDPGAAVALGAPLLVRMFVPLWVVNATPLPVAAWVVPIQPPPAPTDKDQHPSEGLVDPADSIRLETLETENVQMPQGTSRRGMPEGARHAMAGSVSMVAYPMQQLAAFRRTERRQSYGLRIKVGESGWTSPLPLESNANTEAPEDFNIKPVLIRARIPEWGTVHEITARLELVGNGFERTLALRLEPYLVISNQTGVPLQLMQPRGGTIQQSFAGIVPSRATRDGLPRVGVPPAGRSYTGQGPPPEGLRTAISAADADYTSTVDLPTGGAGIPLHWSLQSETRQVSLRFAPDSPGETGPQWSHPLELEKALSSTSHYISLPVRPAASSSAEEAPLIDMGPEVPAAGTPGSSKKKGAYLRELTTLQTAAAPPWELHGLQPRVSRRIKHYARHQEGGLIEEIEVVVVRFRAELRAPGCMHIVLECVSPRAPYLLENRSDQGLRYRQAGISDLPYVPLPPYSAAGFAWQKDPSSGGIPSVELGASKSDARAAVCCMLDPELQRQDEDDTSTLRKAAAGQTLALSAGTELQMTVADREQEIMSAAGLNTVGGTGTVGHGAMERALRIVPGTRASRALAQGGAAGATAEDGGNNALHVRVDIGSLEVSVVDQRPEELIAATAMGVQVQYAAGLGPSGNSSSLRFSVESIQIDDEIPGTRFPVMVCPLAGENGGDGESAQALVQITLVKQAGGPRGQVYYPFISFRVAKTLQFAVAEGLVWRAVEMYQHLDLGALSGPSDERQVAASTDMPVQIALVSLTDLALAVSFRGDPFSRPRWASRMGALSWGLDLANFEGVPVRLHGFEMENVSMMWSAFVAQVFRQVRGQLIGVALSFLRNFGIFSGASGVLGALSRGVAAIGTDQAAQEERAAARQQREIGNVREGLVEGGDALAQGFYRGFTGLVTKPLQGARTGVGGFVKGLGQGLVGAAAQPVSGALDFMSSAFEGIDASSNTILGRLSNRPRAMRRRRLPRAIGGDRKLLPFVRSQRTDQQARIEAVGQVLMWKAVEAAPGLQRLGRRSRRPARAASDRYEEHMLLPDDRVALLTSQRLMLVSAPGFAKVHAAAEEGVQIGSGDDIPAGQIRWSVEWQDLLAMELRSTHRELPYPDRVIVHRKGVPGNEEEEHLAHELRCFPNTAQAEQVKVIALKVRDKFYREPQSESAMWARKHSPDLGAPLPGLGQQTLPATMPSIDFRLVWHTGRMADRGEIISVWRVVSPPGYGALGDVVSLGMDPPTAPVTVYRNDADETGPEKPAMAHPGEFHLVFRENGRSPVTMWEPVAPEGYAALGTLVEGSPQMPDTAEVLCVREDLLRRTGYFDSAIWRWDPPGLQGGLNLQRLHTWDPQTWHCTIWPVDNAGSTFIADRGTRRPSPSAALTPTIE